MRRGVVRTRWATAPSAHSTQLRAHQKSRSAPAKPMARTMRDREIIPNGVCACAGVNQLAPAPVRNCRTEKGGDWLELSFDRDHRRSAA
jgi:hypothetical protein